MVDSRLPSLPQPHHLPFDDLGHIIPSQCQIRHRRTHDTSPKVAETFSLGPICMPPTKYWEDPCGDLSVSRDAGQDSVQNHPHVARLTALFSYSTIRILDVAHDDYLSTRRIWTCRPGEAGRYYSPLQSQESGLEVWIGLARAQSGSGLG